MSAEGESCSSDTEEDSMRSEKSPERSSDETESDQVVRCFLNPAVYIESPADQINEKSIDDSPKIFVHRESNNRSLKIKKCSCSVNPNNCPCHASESYTERLDDITERPETESSITDLESFVTVKPRAVSAHPRSQYDLRLNLTPLATQRTVTLEGSTREEILAAWLSKKDAERRKKEAQERKLEEEKMKIKQEVLEKERENFKRWLADKKMKEAKERKQKEKILEAQRLYEEENERKKAENEQTFQLWLKKKKKLELEKKIAECMKVIEEKENREKRLSENQRAFKMWLQNSKNKPKPIPLNQGLKSLCTSLSVTYINPVPWRANVETGSPSISQ